MPPTFRILPLATSLIWALACAGGDTPTPEVAVSPEPTLVFLGHAGSDTIGDAEAFELELDLDAGRCRLVHAGDGFDNVVQGTCTGTSTGGRWTIQLETEPARTLEVIQFDELPEAEQRQLIERWVRVEPDTGASDAAKMRARLTGGMIFDGRVYR